MTNVPRYILRTTILCSQVLPAQGWDKSSPYPSDMRGVHIRASIGWYTFSQDDRRHINSHSYGQRYSRDYALLILGLPNVEDVLMACNACEITEAYYGNDFELALSDLVDKDDNPLTSATVAYAIYDSDGVVVTGTEGTLSQVGTSNDYAATVDKTVIALLDNGGEYTIRGSGSQSGTDFEFNLTIRVKRRGAGGTTTCPVL